MPHGARRVPQRPEWLARTGLLLLGLTVPVLLFSAQLYVGNLARAVRMPFGVLVILQICHWYLWALAGPVAWALGRRWPPGGAHRARALSRHLAAAVGIGAAVVLGYLLLYHLMVTLTPLGQWFNGSDRSWTVTAVSVFAWLFPLELIVYAGIVAASHAASSTAMLRAQENEALRLQAEVTTTRLQVLRAQLQPHFLFNALHTVGSFVLQRRNDEAVETLAELGDVLRLTLDRRDADQVSLREELGYLRRYLHIEEARFGDRLTVHWRIETDALDAQVPPFILQPIVENALKHGVAKESRSARLEIRAALAQSGLRVSVFNQGPQLPASWSLQNDAGFGLTNVLERLRHRAPPCSLRIGNADEGGVLAILEFPRGGEAGAAGG
jgi:two-component system, LytTR family, sensor kinase